MADALSFSNQADAAYHAHKHIRELGPRPPIQNEVSTYLTAAREHIRSSPAIVRENQNGSRSVVAETKSMRAIIMITTQGQIFIATFGKAN